MPGNSPSSVFDTSSVHCLVSPPSPPMSLKRCTLQSERLFNSPHLGQSLQFVNEKRSFIAQKHSFRATAAHCEYVHVYQPKEDLQCFFGYIFIQRVS
jgi:hypothetical protein